jgi:hypothetical protein
MHTRSFRPYIYLSVVFALCLAACAPAAAVVSTAEPSEPPPTVAPTLAPSRTPLPPTATLEPSATPLPEPTATEGPKPVSTHAVRSATSVPSATPAPGDIAYQADFADDWDQWEEFYFGTDKYTMEADGDSFTIMIDGLDTFVYTVYDRDFPYADMQVDVDVKTISGPNKNNLSLVCRYSEDGWYEFNIESGGLWNILKYSEALADWTMLKSGGSTAIKMNQATNHLTAVCQGEMLTLFINDVKVGSVKDTEFTEGTFGVSASTFELPHVQMRFSNFTVRLADPNAQLGLGVAPTVAPSTGGGDNGASGDWVAGLYSSPIPDGTLADAVLKRDTLNSLLLLLVSDVPAGCGDVRVISTEFVEGVEPVEYDAQGVPIAGSWLERWVVGHCNSQSAYKMTYAFSPNGGVDFNVGRW